MSRPHNIIPIVLDTASGAQRQSVAERIECRRRLLKRWRDEGIPMGQYVPMSLNEARTWDDQQLGILPISWTNGFSTKHAVHGRQVKKIAKLLTEIKKKYKLPKRSEIPADAPVAAPRNSVDLDEHERQLKAAVSQWHAERDAHLRAKRQAEAAESRERAYLAESDMKDRVISDLRRELSGRKGLRVMK